MWNLNSTSRLTWVVLLGVAALCQPATAETAYPGIQPGPMAAVVSSNRVTVRNQAISAEWPVGPNGVGAVTFLDLQGRGRLTLKGELFEIQFADGTRYPASKLVSAGPLSVHKVTPRAGSARLSERSPGQTVEAPFRSADGRLQITWRAVALDEANYVRQELELTALKADCQIRSLNWIQEAIPGARTVGQVDGSLVLAQNFFAGCEDPHALNRANLDSRADAPGNAAQQVICELQRNAVLKRGESLKVGFVVGVAPPKQLRRAFLYYLERERAHPYRPYLHYNSWYDIAWDPFALNETNCFEAIRLIGDRFIAPHGVVLDGMVFDDGWDDPKSLWRFHQGFPRGFSPLTELCKHYGTRLGVWLSPFGGYGESKAQRLRFGAQQGFETNATGFSLAGPKYYAAFKQACVRMIRDFKVNHFKFDGIATGMYASGGGQYLLDTEAMRRLMLELREEEPDLFINLTTGSWPSPFWLRYADSVWRQGGDMGHAGKGTTQQQWLTYRDQETYRNIVRKGPLFPLNSLMSQGVAYSRRGMAGDPSFNASGFRDDVRAFFGSGTGLQELYIQPGKLTTEDWRVLAEAAKWSRANADVLVDTHWIGGDPGKLEVYGYASWTPRKGIVMLRNPSDQPQTASFDLGTIFELPPAAPANYKLKSPWAEHSSEPGLDGTSGQPVTLKLNSFEVMVLDAIPVSERIEHTGPVTGNSSQDAITLRPAVP